MNVSEPRAPGHRLYPFTIVWALVYVICLWLSAREGFPVDIAYYLVLGLGVPLTILTAAEWSAHLPGRKSAFFVLLACASWWLASLLLVRAEYDWRIWHTLNTVTLLIGTFTIGNWLAGEIEKVGHLIPVGILGALVDIWSVFQGPSKSVGRQVVEHVQRQIASGAWQPPPVVEFLILSWPQPGAGFMTPLFGLGDLVFMAVFLAASRRFGISLMKTVLLMAAALAASFIAVFVFNAPIPALPFICGFFVLGNLRSLSLTRSEWRITLIVSFAVLAVGLINWLVRAFTGG